MPFSHIASLSILALVDATCVGNTGMCSGSPAQDNLLLQTDHAKTVWRTGGLAINTSLDPEFLQEAEASVDASSQCADLDGNCRYYTSYCGTENIKKQCRKTCGLCGSPAPASGTGCVDLDGNCRYYTSYCGTENIKRQCRKTCGLCGSPAPAPNPGCTDLDGNCRYYTSYCGTENIKRQCQKTCGLCGSAPGGGGGGSAAKIKVVSYNLWWWKAFKENPSQSSGIIANIKSMRADTLGLQECNDAGSVASRTGNMYSAVSPFSDNQGVMIKPGVFSVLAQGSRDLQARGKWGNRYVNWVKLRHLSSGRSFWHFNTHWCVHSGNGYTCNSGVRATGAKNMLRAIREVAGTTSPVVITGDFNAGMGEAGIQEFLRNGFALARNSGVDAIFYSQGHWSVVAASVGSASGSDHSPVIVDLQLTR